MRIRYSAWLRDSVGCDEEYIVLPADVRNIGMLLDWLAARGERYAKAFEFIDVVPVFVNNAVAKRTDAVNDDDEVLFVPPIAGG